MLTVFINIHYTNNIADFNIRKINYISNGIVGKKITNLFKV